MSGGPACAEAARRKSVAKIPRENLSELKLKSFMIVVISFCMTVRFDGQDAKVETDVNNGGKKATAARNERWACNFETTAGPSRAEGFSA